MEPTLRSSVRSPLMTKAADLVRDLAEGSLADVLRRFDDRMRTMLDAARLAEGWSQATSGRGALLEVTETASHVQGDVDVTVVTCRFERGELDVRVAIDPAGRVCGLHLTPRTEPVTWVPPGYAKPGSFESVDVEVGPLALGGKLFIPRKGRPAPAVVLVHGSGPHDIDETVGLVKPFADLAWGLASRGVAVLRYEKRTKARPESFAGARVTVREETLEDGLAAVRLLRERTEVDARRIAILGHSLGGMLAPRMAAEDAGVAGLILLAANTRPLDVLLLEQAATLGLAAEQKAELERQVAVIRDPKLSSRTKASDLPFGVPASYWLDLRGYDPAAAAAALDVPMLVLQGERDYQVTMADFEGWRRALGGRPDVTLRVYRKANHMFVEGRGPSTPDEYRRPGHVSKGVVEDIASWIGRMAPRPSA